MSQKPAGMAVTLSVERQAVLSKAVALFASKAGEEGAGRSGAGYVVFTGKSARFSNGLTGLEIPFIGLSGCALPLGSAAEVIFRGDEELSVTQSEDAIKVAAGGFSANLRFVPQDSLPAWPLPGKLQSLPVSPDIWEKIASIMFAADPGARSEISGVLLYKTIAFATDGVRAARVRLPGSGGGAGIGLVPLKLIPIVDGLLSLMKPSAVGFGESRVWVSFEGGASAWSVLPAGEYPLGVLSTVAQRSKGAGQELQVSWADRADEVSRAVERVAVFSDGPEVSVQVTKSVLRVHGKGSRGEATGSVVLSRGAELGPVSVNGLLFADAVRRSQGLTASPERDCLFFRCPGFELLLMCLVS